MPDPLLLLISVILFIVYSTIMVITVIFTFFLGSYRWLDEKLKIELIPSYALTPLEENINLIDEWLIGHNRIVGPVLMLLCAFDIKLSFDLLVRF